MGQIGEGSLVGVTLTVTFGIMVAARLLGPDAPTAEEIAKLSKSAKIPAAVMAQPALELTDTGPTEIIVAKDFDPETEAMSFVMQVPECDLNSQLGVQNCLKQMMIAAVQGHSAMTKRLSNENVDPNDAVAGLRELIKLDHTVLLGNRIEVKGGVFQIAYSHSRSKDGIRFCQETTGDGVGFGQQVSFENQAITLQTCFGQLTTLAMSMGVALPDVGAIEVTRDTAAKMVAALK